MSENEIKKGGISVETEHIFPIIKKWLYSDKEIFLREIVSNACDAVTKLRRLSSLGQYEEDGTPYRIDVTLNKEERTLTVSDNGIGMTSEELEKYLCSIALSGALDFINKYEGDSTENNGIIGHFGLGFYSSFMVSDYVTVNTKSFTGGEPVCWTCKESGEYEFSTSSKATKGTDVIMHIADGEEEFLSADKLKGILDEYCSFMPVEIYFNEIKEEKEDDKKDKKDEKEEIKPINDVNPLWMKNPSDCTDEEYKAFYTKVFKDYHEPLFWIHINADYPLNFKGILYFPKIANEYESLEGQVKLYYNQVFVADNIKEVIPEFLLMLRGVIDCPELPLNVSRSYLQNSGYVSKISKHIVKKVGDKVNSLFTNEREKYEGLWKDLKIFLEYGSLREQKFYEKIKDSFLYELVDGKYQTLPEYLEDAKEKHENKVYYCNDKVAQSRYISLLKEQNVSVVNFDKNLDNQFITMIEQNNSDVKFLRVDSGVADILKGDGEVMDSEKLKDAFVKASGNDKLKVSFETLKDVNTPAMMILSEEDRRFGEMMKLYGMGDNMPAPEGSLVLNSCSDVIKSLKDKAENGEDVDFAAQYIYKLAVLAQRRLDADELNSFLGVSYELIKKSLS